MSAVRSLSGESRTWRGQPNLVENDPQRTLPSGSTAAQNWGSIGGIMQFDIDKMAAADRYELLLGTVVPRPIALVTTISSDGAINAAPYSLFNVMGHDPAVA